MYRGEVIEPNNVFPVYSVGIAADPEPNPDQYNPVHFCFSSDVLDPDPGIYIVHFDHFFPHHFFLLHFFPPTNKFARGGGSRKTPPRKFMSL